MKNNDKDENVFGILNTPKRFLSPQMLRINPRKMDGIVEGI